MRFAPTVLIGLCAALLAGAAAAAPPSLALKARVFEHDMEERFLLDGQALCKLRNATPDRPHTDYNMPDNAYMTGIYTATLSMKHAVTRDPADRERALRSLRALHLLCTVAGKRGVLARAAWPKDRPTADDGVWRDSPDGVHKWRGDVSTDQVDGVMFGLYFAHELVAGDEEKRMIADDASALLDLIVENNFRIVDVDGKPTVWSKYHPDHVRKREKMNALLFLQACKITAHVTGDAKYADIYRKYAVDEQCAEAAVEARICVNPLMPRAVNHSDDVLQFLAYAPLMHLETDPALRALYEKSLRRSWEGNGRHPGVAPEGNPFYAFVMAKHLDERGGLEAGLDTLRRFPFRMKWRPDTIETYRTLFGFDPDPGPLSPEPEEGKPVPVDRRGTTWSAWVQDPYFGSDWDAPDAVMEYNGHDYLLAYWTGRHYGFLSEEQ
ncbi:MAG: hypothetical protein GXY15_05325 [Candidatus Hydrogenedentes bacterium]|nr:hypothetical protein [Candidatus Hydrogenedentota bacterium]